MDDAAGVIVVYFPKYPILERLINLLTPQVAAIYVVNNGPIDSQHLQFKRKYARPNINFLEMGKNVGIGRALNQGLSAAIAMGFNACWTFDQDSIPGENDGVRLRTTLARARQRSKKVAAVVPLIYNENRKAYLPFLVPGPRNTVSEELVVHSQEVSAAISSGMMIDAEAWSKIGPMNERYFIDLVDTEWCFRAREQGYRIICETDAVLRHALGEECEKTKYFGFVTLRQRSPARTYYIVRNTLALGGAHYAPANWERYGMRKLLKLGLLALTMGPDRIAQCKEFMRGLRDGKRFLNRQA